MDRERQAERGASAAARTVAECVSDPAHAGPLAGAARVGTARDGERTVRIGLWMRGGRVVRARFQATSCASLIAYAEVACGALEAGAPPEALDARALRRLLRGVHPAHLDRSALVSRALRAAAPSPEDA